MTKNLYQLYKSNFGINNSIAKLLCRHIGHHGSINTSNLSQSYMLTNVKKLLQYKEQYLGKNLTKTVSDNILRKTKSNLYQGFLLRHGLPTRGQRKRSNARTVKSFIKRVRIK